MVDVGVDVVADKLCLSSREIRMGEGEEGATEDNAGGSMSMAIPMTMSELASGAGGG